MTVANVALSLFYYVRLIEPLYLRVPQGTVLAAEPGLLRVALLVLAAGTLCSGVFPRPWVALAIRAAALLRGGGASSFSKER